MSLISDLEQLLGADRVLHEPVELYLYSKDASSLVRGQPNCVVFPRTTVEVSEIVKLAEVHDAPVVARGAGTGLTAGASPTDGGIVVSTTSLNSVDIDPENQSAWVGAGVINLDLTNAAAPFGLQFAPDPSSQSACTIGGNVANNSGGPHCLAEGSTTSHILGLEVVLAGGEVMVLGGLAPDTPGLDLKGLIVGSEGTLGVVTRALVRLIPVDPDVRTLLIDFDRVEDACGTVSDIIAAGCVPAALEMMDQRMMQAVENWLQAGLPTNRAAILLVEVVGETAGVEAEAELVREIALNRHSQAIRVAVTEAERQLLWKGRKSAFGAVAQLAPDYYLHDTVVPRTRLVETMTDVYEIADRHGLLLVNVFHAGDGNLHPLIAFDSSDPVVAERVRQAGDEIVALCIRNGGALTGEHGIGVEKRNLMKMNFSELDLDAQARLKDTFDPKGTFNPSKVLPQGSLCFDFGGVRKEIPEGAWV
jgi:glycolate oxidase